MIAIRADAELCRSVRNTTGGLVTVACTTSEFCFYSLLGSLSLGRWTGLDLLPEHSTIVADAELRRSVRIATGGLGTGQATTSVFRLHTPARLSGWNDQVVTGAIDSGYTLMAFGSITTAMRLLAAFAVEFVFSVAKVSRIKI
jgi:hypothetical protein